MNNSEIVSKLWNLCNVLRDDGITYHQYVTELTYILFLKMAKETETEGAIPEEYRWDELVKRDGVELKKFYNNLLTDLGEHGGGRIKEIYSGARSNIEEPANLRKIITNIDGLDWYSAKEEGLGNLYEGLLEKNANEKKSGAGQYFTPRVLIDVMTELIAPQPGERCNDPACGTFGFMIAADRYVKEHTDDLFDLTAEQQAFQRNEAFTGGELVHETHRLALMNAMLHDINGKIQLGDTLSNMGKSMKGYDVVLTNPPFGTKKGGERASRDDLTFLTSNKQLNFLQHIYRSLRTDTGKARAAVVLPDNVLFADGDGESIRKDLMEKCNLHTILRLPTGIFYAQGVKTNVLFFDRGKSDTGNTKEVWIYDLRSDMPSFGKTNPLQRSHFDEFVECYCAGHMEDRKPTYSEENPEGRWRKYSYEEILQRDKTSLDITWIRSGNDTDDRSLAELLGEIEEKASNINEAVAKELKTRGLHHNAVVILGAGVPFKRFGEEAGKLTAYLSRTGIHDFIFEEEEYSIAIEKVYCFPQCFAAVADRIANMEGRYVVADIGSWTKDIISIVDKRIDTEKSVTVPNSIITLFGEINDGVMQIGCGRILEEVLQDFIIGKEVVMPEKAQAVVISKLKEFAMEIEGLLGESGFDLDYCNVLYIGGGATIMKRFGEHKENVAYLEDIRLNAKGYELLASHQMKRG